MGKRKKRGEKTRLQRVPGIPAPGSVLRRDGTWLEPQPHGGYLLRDGAPNGRPSSELRSRMRGHVSEQMHVAVAILADSDASNRDRLQALDLLARYGLGQRQDKVDPELIRALALSVQAEVQDPQVLTAIQKRWADVLKEYVTGAKVT